MANPLESHRLVCLNLLCITQECLSGAPSHQTWRTEARETVVCGLPRADLHFR